MEEKGGFGCCGFIVLAWVLIGVGTAAGLISGADGVGAILDYLVDIILWPWR